MRSGTLLGSARRLPPNGKWLIEAETGERWGEEEHPSLWAASGNEVSSSEAGEPELLHSTAR